MKVVTLCSGSKGNSTYIEVKGKKFLIDAGTSYKYINESLKKINIDVKDIDFIFVTHNHRDHILGLNSIVKYTKAQLCIPKNLYESLKEQPISSKIIYFEDEIVIENIEFIALKSSHDAPDSRNYIIKFENKKISLITDTGYVKQKHFKLLYNSDIFLMESNHDIDLLQNGKYPHYLKQRILSDVGHLSNNQAGFYLSKIIGPNTKYILLIHLSDENNKPEVAIETVDKILKDYNISFSNIKCAMQFELSEVMEID